jgi:hypothetical protein
MARTYKRDRIGRFSSTGGGGGRKGSGSKGKAKSKSSNVAERKQKLVKEVSSNALAGRKNSSARTSYVRAQQQSKVAAQSNRGSGNKAARRAAAATAKAAQSARTKQFSSKASSSKAKAAYKAARSAAREAKMLAGGRTSTRGLSGRKDSGATNIRANVKRAQAAAAKVRKLERNRGTSRR